MKDAASKGASVKTGLSEVEKIGPIGSEMKTTGKDQKPTANPKESIKSGRPGKFRFC